MKNRRQLYGKCMVSMVIVGMMLSFVSAVWAAPQQLQSRESKPIAMTETDVWIDDFKVGNKSRDCRITNPGPSGCDVYEGDQLAISGMVLICGCCNRPVRVKIEVDAQLLREDLMGLPDHSSLDPSKPVCYQTLVCPVSNGRSNGATWIAFPGTHTLKFTVDSNDEIIETNEHNNSKSVTVTVKRRPLPPLPETKPKIPIKIPIPNSPAGSQQR